MSLRDRSGVRLPPLQHSVLVPLRKELLPLDFCVRARSGWRSLNSKLHSKYPITHWPVSQNGSMRNFKIIISKTSALCNKVLTYLRKLIMLSAPAREFVAGKGGEISFSPPTFASGEFLGTKFKLHWIRPFERPEQLRGRGWRLESFRPHPKANQF